MWLENQIFRKHLGDRKPWYKWSLLKYTWKSLFSGIKVRKLSKKWLAPKQVIHSGMKPRYSELPFLFLSAEENYFRLDTLGKPTLYELNTTVSLSPLDILIFCLWFCFVILSMAGLNMNIHMLVFAFPLLCHKFLRILKLDNAHQLMAYFEHKSMKNK